MNTTHDLKFGRPWPPRAFWGIARQSRATHYYELPNDVHPELHERMGTTMTEPGDIHYVYFRRQEPGYQRRPSAYLRPICERIALHNYIYIATGLRRCVNCERILRNR